MCNFAAAMRYFITFSYDGTAYHGWQVQPGADTVQARLEAALSTILRQPVGVVGAGRTDAGVHARMMVAHFDFPAIPDDLAYKLNRLLPRDIAVGGIRPVADTMHARFSATKRTYHYYLHTAKDPFARHYSWRCPYPLDFRAMNEAAALLPYYSDFAAFCKSHTDVKTTICRVGEARWEQLGPTQWRFVISADRFLRNMVRAVVGTLIEVGRGRMSLDGFRGVVEGRNRCNAGESMPANALALVGVEYEGDMDSGKAPLPDLSE